MKYNIKNILRERLICKKLVKKIILKKILKSVIQNNNIINNTKIYTNYILKKREKHHGILSRKNKICLYTGKRSGVLKGFNFSRDMLKKFILSNKLTNFKQHNW